MAKNFNTLLAKIPKERREKIEERVQRELVQMTLRELRKELNVNQSQVAENLKMGQPAVSKLESRSNLPIGTIDAYVRAMGGKLEVRAVFPERAVALKTVRSPQRAAKRVVAANGARAKVAKAA